MINVSNEFAQLISQNTRVEVKATLTLANGTVRYLTGDDFMMGTTVFTESTSSASSFDIGSAIIGQLDLTLNNYDGRFDDYDFTGATLVPYVGVRLSGGTVEWVRRGRYIVDQPDVYGTTIGLTCLDLMSKLERPYNDVGTTYPATLRTIVRDIATTCGISLESALFDNDTYVVAERPDNDTLTCLAMLGYVVQIAGSFARMTNTGQLRIGWYNTSVLESEDWLDGGTYATTTRPYSDGDTADGGDFTNYSSGATYDGGTFERRPWVNLYAYSSISLSTDDVVVTGVAVTAQDDKTEEEGGTDQEGETTLYGTEGYVLAIKDNPLIAFGRSSEVAAQVGQRVVGMRFRPFDVSALGDPTVEAGDPVIISDSKQDIYRSYVTSLTYRVNAYATMACDAETPGRHTATGFSAVTKAIVDARNALRRERTAREQALERLNTELEESSGLYNTVRTQQDGSSIYYAHDKPELAESGIVWKWTAEAIGISTNGGRSYSYGLDVSGNAILERVYTIGLDADYINTGALVVKRDGTTVFSADVDTGVVTLQGDCVTIGSESLTTAINGVRALYGTCNTGQSTATKAVACSGFVLRAGAVVNVRFTYKNTASNPKLNVNGTGAKDIYINNSVMTSDYYWNAQDVVTFVYSGTYWYVADSGTLAKIKTTADSITLSVQQTYATKSELTVGLNSISLNVTNGTIGSNASIVLSANGRTVTKNIDMRNVRNAFKNDTTAITITAGTVTFNSNTFVVNSTYFKVSSTGVITATSGTIGGFTITSSSIYNSLMTLQSDGLHMKRDNTAVGHIGTNSMSGYSYQRGLVFDLEATGNYMCWAAKSSSSASTYSMKLTYANKSTNGYTTGRLSVSCDFDLCNYRAYRFWIDPNTGGANGGVTGTMNFVQVSSVNSDGRLSYWYTGCRMRFKNGLLVEGTFNS